MPLDEELNAQVHAPPIAVVPLLEVAHVAHRLRFSQDYVRTMIRQGQLVAHRFGARWRVDPRDLQAFIDAKRVAHRGDRGIRKPIPEGVTHQRPHAVTR